MDNTYATIGSTSGVVALIGGIGYLLYRFISHSRCRSHCCAKPLLDLYVNLSDEKDGDGKMFVPFKPVSPKLPVPPPATRQSGEP